MTAAQVMRRVRQHTRSRADKRLVELYARGCVSEAQRQSCLRWVDAAEVRRQATKGSAQAQAALAAAPRKGHTLSLTGEGVVGPVIIIGHALLGVLVPALAVATIFRYIILIVG